MDWIWMRNKKMYWHLVSCQMQNTALRWEKGLDESKTNRCLMNQPFFFVLLLLQYLYKDLWQNLWSHTSTFIHHTPPLLVFIAFAERVFLSFLFYSLSLLRHLPKHFAEWETKPLKSLIQFLFIIIIIIIICYPRILIYFIIDRLLL